MAMGLVTGALGSLIPKLLELVKDEYKLQTRLKDQVEYLTRELESALAVLAKVAKVPPDQLDGTVRIWARDVREASYDMEDILDAFLVRVEGDNDPSGKENKLKRLQKRMKGLFKTSMERHKIASAIEKIKNHLQEVTERHARYTEDSIVAKPTPSQAVDPRLKAMYREAAQIIGIDESRRNLISKLSMPQGDNDESNKKMKIVSIVGVGGLGKTTLAKAVYDKLKPLYDCGAFIPVGRNPDLKKILQHILIDLGYNDFSKIKIFDEERQFINEFHSFLKTRRYFIVIDDVWEKQSWETIKLALVDNNTGSRIITTTRNLEVALTGDEVYKLPTLSYGNSKKLFYTRIYGGEEKCPNNQSSEVHEASEKILKKCGGVPLAIITMASLLVGKSNEVWFEVCKSIGFHDKEKEEVEDTMWILSLSYYDLPPHLRTCLLYLSAFPEDHFIDKDPLIWTWIAEGFVQKKSGLGLFEVGEGYFIDLINRSMIQEEELHVGDDIIYGCRVHDIVLDLIRSLSHEENFVTVLDKGRLSGSSARRLALQNRTVDHTLWDKHMDVQQVRSFIACQCDYDDGLLVQGFELLRVLHLEHSFKLRHLEHLGSLLHLRCLVLTDVKISELPKEIGALKFLQVLYMDRTSITELPSSVGLLTRLVCLHAPGVVAPDGIIRKLTSLEELQIEADGGDNSMRQFVEDVGYLHELRVLRTRVISGQVSDLWKYLVNPQHLEFHVELSPLLRKKCSRHNLGLEYMRSLQKVKVHFDCWNAFADEVEKEESALWNAIEVLPHKLTLCLYYSRAMELVTGAVGSLIQKLRKLLEDQYKMQADMKDQVKYLMLELKSAHEVLQEVVKVPPDQLNGLVRIWAREIREASYGMEDILDAILVCVKDRGNKTVHQDSFLKHLVQSKERHKIAGAIEKIKKHLQEVTDRRGRYTLENIMAMPASSQTVDPHLAATNREMSQLIGIDSSIAELMSFLSPKGDNEESNKKIEILSVVGSRGLGKSTLAKAVYDELKPLFDYGAFIPFGRYPDLKKILTDILIDLGDTDFSKITLLDEMQLINKLRIFLGTKRYFIVIDDLWETRSWEKIKLALVENNSGSRIIITTRNHKLAFGIDEVYKLRPLSVYDSTRLLYARIYGGDGKYPNNLSSEAREASMKIVLKCRGVPLAIITAASFLIGKSQEDWYEACESIGLHNKEREGMYRNMWIVSLSYYDLPPHLRTCLLS